MDNRHLASGDWLVIGASVIGRSHELTETRCQDAYAAAVVHGEGGDAMIVAAADGAGSAALSHIGAQTATRTITERISQHLKRFSDMTLSEEDLRRMVKETRDAVVFEAEERARDLREFASTLVVLVMLPNKTLGVHIGDGAIIVDDGELSALSWPEQGEYANSTVFVTMANSDERARFVETKRVERFAVFTDGLQSLALDYATKTPFEPFIIPMLEALESEDVETSRLEIALGEYLISEAINAKTDDDKTLILGIRTPR